MSAASSPARRASIGPRATRTWTRPAATTPRCARTSSRCSSPTTGRGVRRSTAAWRAGAGEAARARQPAGRPSASRRCSAPAAWARCIARTIPGSDARSRSRSCPTPFAHDADRRSRFEHEARALAALNHPHIGAIYGVEESGDVAALVLELVEGPTLAERLAAGPLVDRRDRLDRTADRGGARGGARSRHRPSRSEARQHQDHARRHRQRSSTSDWPKLSMRLRLPCRARP